MFGSGPHSTIERQLEDVAYHLRPKNGVSYDEKHFLEWMNSRNWLAQTLEQLRDIGVLTTAQHQAYMELMHTQIFPPVFEEPLPALPKAA